MKVGISACVLGERVRFDSGHKRNAFVCNELSQFVEFVPICPEVGIGLPVPRPTIRLVEFDDQSIHLLDGKNPNIDHSQAMQAFSTAKIRQLEDKKLCGYIVCAKSPTCGMERVKVYPKSGNRAEKKGQGLFTATLMQQMPWLPVEEDGRLHCPELKENFVFRLFALQDFYDSVGENYKPCDFIDFHSRYKLMLMAHNPSQYKALGQLVAQIAEYDLEQFYLIYRTRFMQAISHCATRKNNTNVLMHLQGYFKAFLNRQQKAELSMLIKAYHRGHMPLLAPLTLINHYLDQYPNPYLTQQSFLKPYPDCLKLRYGL